jgi:multidrug efflux pump subunit AcrA (membrane-fusion protein)
MNSPVTIGAEFDGPALRRREPTVEKVSSLLRVVVADQDEHARAWLEHLLAGEAAVFCAETSQAALAILFDIRPQILVVGRTLADIPGSAFLDLLGDEARRDFAVLYVADVDRKAPIPEHDAVYFVLRRDMPADDVRTIIARAATPENLETSKPSAEEAARLRRILEAARLFGQARNLEAASRIATRALVELLSAERAQCLFYDQTSGALWAEDSAADGEAGRQMSARVGLAAFAVRAGSAVCVDRADGDPRYRRDVDDPAGRGDDRLLVQPVADAAGHIHAVLIAARGATAPRFDDESRSIAARLAERFGPLAGQLALEIEADGVLEEAHQNGQRTFREEALAAHDLDARRGDVVRVSPRWVASCYWLIVVILAAVAVFLVLGRLSEYSTGPAVVYQSGRVDVTAATSGNIASIHVVPGQEVHAGQVLARLDAPEEAAELARLEREWQNRLRDYLARPADLDVRAALGALRAERERIAERTSVRAEQSGVVSDVRIAPGQRVLPGQTILALTKPESALHLVALLPGGDRPLLRPGMALRLEVAGYRYAYQNLTVDAIVSEILGPGEAARYLGAQLADSIPVVGSVVIVKAALPVPTFDVAGETFHYHHGMQGKAEVRVRSSSVLRALLPEFP